MGRRRLSRGAGVRGDGPVLSCRRCPRRTWPHSSVSAPVFAGLPAREIDALAALTEEEAHRARSYIFMEGDHSRWFYLVKSGHVKIVRHSKAGKDVVLELLGPVKSSAAWP